MPARATDCCSSPRQPATIAGGLSAGGAKWAEAAAEREAEQRVAATEAAELDADLHGEIAELAAHWESKGLSTETAQKVAEELTAHDALAAQLEAEYGIDELMAPAGPIWSGVSLRRSRSCSGHRSRC